MISDRDVDDVSLILEENLPSKLYGEAVTRLSTSQSADVRMIAAQSILTPQAKYAASRIATWIDRERSADIRSKLYLSLATRDGVKAIPTINKRLRLSNSAFEMLHLAAAQAVARSSRAHLLDVMRYMFDKDDRVAEAAGALCRMLVDEEDIVTKKFIDLLEEAAAIDRNHSNAKRATYRS